MGEGEATAIHEWCRRCERENVSWAAPSPLWNLVMRGGSINGDWQHSELICIGCFVDLARLAGVAGHWRVTVSPEPEGMETVTPSGRVWDPETWLWKEPADD